MSAGQLFCVGLVCVISLCGVVGLAWAVGLEMYHVIVAALIAWHVYIGYGVEGDDG
jgi:hypothetical protein